MACRWFDLTFCYYNRNKTSLKINQYKIGKNVQLYPSKLCLFISYKPFRKWFIYKRTLAPSSPIHLPIAQWRTWSTGTPAPRLDRFTLDGDDLSAGANRDGTHAQSPTKIGALRVAGRPDAARRVRTPAGAPARNEAKPSITKARNFPYSLV